MTCDKKVSLKAKEIGCYIILTYILYWPAIYAARSGVAWHETRHTGFIYDWGNPYFWAVMWVFAPITTPFLLFINAIYWIVVPILDFIVQVFW